MLAAYGNAVLCGQPLDYLRLFQLWLNLPRVRTQWAVRVWQGIDAASPRAELGREWAEAFAACEEEVDEVDFQIREGKRDARIAERRGW